MLVNEEFKQEIKRTFLESFRDVMISGGNANWKIKDKISLDQVNEDGFFLLTMSSQLFRVFILLHFSKTPEMEQYVCNTLKLNANNIDEEKFYDYLGELGNSFLGYVKRDIGRAVPSLGMSTPNLLSKDCLKYINVLQADFEAHAIAELDDQPLIYASVYLVADDELNIQISKTKIEDEVDSGELEMF